MLNGCWFLSQTAKQRAVLRMLKLLESSGATTSVANYCWKGHHPPPSSSCRYKKKDTNKKIKSQDVTAQKVLPTWAQPTKKTPFTECKPLPPSCSGGNKDAKKEPSNKPKDTGSSDDSACSGKTSFITCILGGLLAAALALAAAYGLGYLGPKQEEPPEKSEKKKEEEPETPPERPTEKKKDSSGIIFLRKIKKPPKIPAESTDLPDNVPYLFIGGGTATYAAVRSLRKLEPKAKILVISNGWLLPYMKPALSRDMWLTQDPNLQRKRNIVLNNGIERSIYYEPCSFYVEPKALMSRRKGGVAVARGWKVQRLDVIEKKAILDDGYEIKYDKCLLATGAKPVCLPVLEQSDADVQARVINYNTICDFEYIKQALNLGVKDIAIVGGGFIGTELASTMNETQKDKGVQVHQIVREQGVLTHVLPDYLGKWLAMKMANDGVSVYTNCEIKAASLQDNKVLLKLSNGKTVPVDLVIVAIGVEPNTELADTSCLETDPVRGGFLVNAELLARSDHWSAGDCACFFDHKWGRRREEHHYHAFMSGKLAGENMLGAKKPYTEETIVWHDLSNELGYEAVGMLDSKLPSVGVFAHDDESLKARQKRKDMEISQSTPIKEVVDPGRSENTENMSEGDQEDGTLSELAEEDKPAGHIDGDYSKGLIFYHRNNVIVGIVMWNVFHKIGLAKQILREQKTTDDLPEIVKQFEIHDDD